MSKRKKTVSKVGYIAAAVVLAALILLIVFMARKPKKKAPMSATVNVPAGMPVDYNTTPI